MNYSERLLKKTGDYWRLLKNIGECWRLLGIGLILYVTRSRHAVALTKTKFDTNSYAAFIMQ